VTARVVPLTADARRGVALAALHPTTVCPGCGRKAIDHAPGAWGSCEGCGRLVHRYGAGGTHHCRVCREERATTAPPEAS